MITTHSSHPELVTPWLFLAFLKELEAEVLEELRDEELTRDEPEAPGLEAGLVF